MTQQNIFIHNHGKRIFNAFCNFNTYLELCVFRQVSINLFHFKFLILFYKNCLHNTIRDKIMRLSSNSQSDMVRKKYLNHET